MRVTFEKIDELSTSKVEFYSVKLGDCSLAEFQKFDNKEFPQHLEELQIAYKTIKEIGKRGARSYFFKFESAAHALPIVSQAIMDANKEDFGLRLYCIRLTDNVLVLLNGDIKTDINPINCKNVKEHFSNANKIAKRLDKGLLDREINYQTIDCLINYEIEI